MGGRAGGPRSYSTVGVGQYKEQAAKQNNNDEPVILDHNIIQFMARP